MEERKRKLLKRLEEYFVKEESVEEVSLFTKEELNTPMDMLRALTTEYGSYLIDVLAEFSFLPLEGKQEIWFFNSGITRMTNVPKKKVHELGSAISRLNFYLPYGSFALSPDGKMLIYKSVTALKADEDDDKLFEDIRLSADLALFFPEGQTGLLIDVAEGDLSLGDYIRTLPE